jgi:MFS family permease
VTEAAARSTAPSQVVRDRTTWLAYVQVGLFGYYLYAFGPSIALLRDEQGTSRAVASLHGAAMAVGAILLGFAAPAVVRRTGRGMMLRIGSLMIVVGLALYIATLALPLTLLGAFVASAGGTMALVGCNAFIPDHHGTDAAQSMSEMHAFGATMGLLGPLAVGIGVWLTWGWRPALASAAVAFLVLELARGRHLEPFDGPHGRPDAATSHAAGGPLSTTFWFALVAFGCAAATEFSLTFWGSDLLRDRAGLGDAAAAASLATIIGGLAVGRIVGSRVVAQVDPEWALLGSFALSLVGFAVAWFGTSAAVMLVGFAITGLGMGLQSPLGIGRAVRAAGAQVDRGSGLSSVAAGTATGLAPFALGALADHVGVHTAFVVVPVFLVTAIVLVRFRRVDLDVPVPA